MLGAMLGEMVEEMLERMLGAMLEEMLGAMLEEMLEGMLEGMPKGMLRRNGRVCYANSHKVAAASRAAPLGPAPRRRRTCDHKYRQD